jgi:hypothetical protein
MALEIKDDDRAYLGWLVSHPNGFVVNAARTPSPDYLVLHRATCGTISGMPARGNRWTTGEYLKVCSEDRADLERWAHNQVGGTLHPCGTCKP